MLLCIFKIDNYHMQYSTIAIDNIKYIVTIEISVFIFTIAIDDNSYKDLMCSWCLNELWLFNKM